MSILVWYRRASYGFSHKLWQQNESSTEHAQAIATAASGVLAKSHRVVGRTATRASAISNLQSPVSTPQASESFVSTRHQKPILNRDTYHSQSVSRHSWLFRQKSSLPSRLLTTSRYQHVS